MSTESLSDSFLNVTRLFVSVQEKTTFLFEEGSPVLQINVGVERTELAKASFTQEEVRFSKLISLNGKLDLLEVQLTLKE